MRAPVQLHDDVEGAGEQHVERLARIALPYERLLRFERDGNRHFGDVGENEIIEPLECGNRGETLGDPFPIQSSWRRSAVRRERHRLRA